jgi:ABC-type glutathione transport system ATPase component
VLIIHDLAVAATTPDRVVVLTEGRVTAAGPPALVLPELDGRHPRTRPALPVDAERVR